MGADCFRFVGADFFRDRAEPQTRASSRAKKALPHRVGKALHDVLEKRNTALLWERIFSATVLSRKLEHPVALEKRSHIALESATRR